MVTQLSRRKKKFSLLNWLDELDFWNEWYISGNFWFRDINGVRSKKEGSSIKYFLDVPGLEKKDVSVSLESGYLIVKGKSEKDYVPDRYYSIYVGDISSSDISASLDKGVLTVEISSKEDKKTKIPIK